MGTGDFLGGGVVVALAAVLWLIYLIPTWLRRREYMATERNAVRLQQTLRILAEAAEVPEEVRVEAKARQLIQQQKLLRKAQRYEAKQEKMHAQAIARAEAQAKAEERAREEAIARAEAAAAAEARAWAEAEARARAAQRKSRAGAEARAAAVAARPASSALTRMRRGRLLALALLVAGLALVAAGAALGGAVVAIVAGIALALAGVGLLVLIARRIADAKAAVAIAPVPERRSVVSEEVYDESVPDFEMSEQLAAIATWTPQPLPRPLHLSRGTIAASTMASITAAAELRRAAARAELEEKAAELQPAKVAPLAPKRAASVSGGAEGVVGSSSIDAERAVGAVPLGPASRYASMGIIEATDAPALDLDAALRRRRAV